MKHFKLIGVILIVLVVGVSLLWWKPAGLTPSPESKANAPALPTAQTVAGQAAGATSPQASPPVTKRVSDAPEQVKAFRDWANDYLRASQNEQQAMEARGAELAKAHTEA